MFLSYIKFHLEFLISWWSRVPHQHLKKKKTTLKKLKLSSKQKKHTIKKI